MVFTDSRSFSEKCSPTPNISRMISNLGEFVGDVLIGDVARRERPHRHAGDQIADQRREPHAMRGEAE